MRLTKELADKMARYFRAELNKSSRDGLVHVCHFAVGKGAVISFQVSVASDGNIQWFDGREVQVKPVRSKR